MTLHYESHVASVLDAFMNMLEPEVKESISQEHLDELSMLVESAITSAVFQQLETVADQVSDMAVGIRRRAENFEPSSKAG